MTKKEAREDIVIVTYRDEQGVVRVSHGCGRISLKGYVLPGEPISEFQPKRWDETLGAWVC